MKYSYLLALCCVLAASTSTTAFQLAVGKPSFVARRIGSSSSSICAASKNTVSFEWLPDSDTPVPFVDTKGNNFIDCYVDSVATIDGVQYTVGSPCDHPVALCMYDEQDELVTIELEDEFMDEVFPVAESVIEEQFGEDLVLVRTPQTLTLAGELDVDEDTDDDDDDDDIDEEEEQVELLVTFDLDDGREVHLVRLLDPVSLVGKVDQLNPNRRLLLSTDESAEIMPILEPLYKQKLDELQDEDFFEDELDEHSP